MKLDSKWFDRIRIGKTKAAPLPRAPRCAVVGCKAAGEYPAPRGRQFEGQYLHLCLDHVRAYNKAYNYFSGMSESEVAEFQIDNVTGHRPTWSMGRADRGPARPARFDMRDPFEIFRDGAPAPKRRVPPLAARALDTLGLDADAGKTEIHARYKLLVKRLHPDSNGGDRSSEARLAQIIQAYRQLRKAGFC
ncbi:MAG: J domain-containing protein [Flavobacteriaceae bacterium]